MKFKKFLKFYLCIIATLFGMTLFANNTYAVNKYARVILVGNLGSGKTSLWKSFFSVPYDPNEMSSDIMMRRDYNVTVGSDNIQFNIWDTAGMAKYYDEVVAFTKDANFVFIVHDLSARYDPPSEAYLTKLYRDVHSQIKADGAVVLVGTKNDKRHDDIKFRELGEHLANLIGNLAKDYNIYLAKQKVPSKAKDGDKVKTPDSHPDEFQKNKDGSYTHKSTGWKMKNDPSGHGGKHWDFSPPNGRGHLNVGPAGNIFGGRL